MKAVGLVLLFCLSLAGPAHADWVLSGFEWHLRPAPPEPVVDAERVSAQQAQGCSQGPVRFGDTAWMRGTAPAADWRDRDRLAASIAAFADRPQTAMSALSDPSDMAYRALLRGLLALQLGDPDAARDHLRASGPLADLPPALASDVIFWTVMTEADTATPPDWRTRLVPDLDAAHRADPTSFQVRAWRVIGWYRGESYTDGSSCAARLDSFADRLLDLSEASACPLMLGHVSHAINRALKSRPDTDTQAARVPWRLFQDGLFATVTGAAEMRATALTTLSQSQAACAPLLASELARIGMGP